MEQTEYLKARIEALEIELERVRQEKLFLASELRRCKIQTLKR